MLSQVPLSWFSLDVGFYSENNLLLCTTKDVRLSPSEYAHRCLFHLMDVVSCYDANNVASRGTMFRGTITKRRELSSSERFVVLHFDKDTVQGITMRREDAECSL